MDGRFTARFDRLEESDADEALLRQQGHGLTPVPSCCLICTKRPLSDPSARSKPAGDLTPRKMTLVSCRSASLPHPVRVGSCRRGTTLPQLTSAFFCWGRGCSGVPG